MLLRDESELANFLTYGFAELEFHVRPTRQDLVLALFKVLTEVFRSLKTPVVVAFDQLEDLLLARRSDDAHKTAEAFFAGIVQVMHQIDGLLFLIFAERGLWNRFVPSLDGYIQDRLNNPVHVPKHGTVKTLRLEAPPAELVRRVVEARLRPCLDELPTGEAFSEIAPFTDDQVMRVARTEPTLRDMLQQFRHLFDHVVYGPDDVRTDRASVSRTGSEPGRAGRDPTRESAEQPSAGGAPTASPPVEAATTGDLTVAARREPAADEPTEVGPPAPVNRIEPAIREQEPPEPPAPVSRLLPTEEEPPAPVNRLDASGEMPFGRPMLPPEPDPVVPPEVELRNRINALLGNDAEEPPAVTFKHVDVIQAPPEPPALPAAPTPAEPEPGPLPPEPIAMGPAVDDVPSAVPVDEVPLTRRAGGVSPPSPAPAVNPPPTPVAHAPGSPEPVAAAPEVPPAPFQVHVAAAAPPAAVVRGSAPSAAALVELWDQEQRAARRKLEPEGSLTGATRELQAGLGTLLAVCHEHGVKVGPWRLQHVVPEWGFGDHPTYGVVTIAHWACKDGQPWKVGVGLFLARGAGKPKDLEVKLAVMDTEPAVVDHLILLRPEDDLTVTGKSKTLWQEAERRGRHARLEPVSPDGFAQLYSFPRWLAAVRESLPAGTPLPNLADVIQEKCEKLLEQVCMPVQG